MKNYFVCILLLIAFASCNDNEGSAVTSLPKADVSGYKEDKSGDKWIPDQNTRQELLALQNTITNFDLLKKKIQTIESYNEYGHLIEMHVERISNVNVMHGEPQKLLQNQLDLLKSKIPLLQINDFQKLVATGNELTQIMKQLEMNFYLEY